MVLWAEMRTGKKEKERGRMKVEIVGLLMNVLNREEGRPERGG